MIIKIDGPSNGFNYLSFIKNHNFFYENNLNKQL